MPAAQGGAFSGRIAEKLVESNGGRRAKALLPPHLVFDDTGDFLYAFSECP